MTKLFGACLLVLCAWAAGFAAAETEGEKLHAVNALYGFLGRLERGISGTRTPLKEIFARDNDEYLEKTGFLPALRSAGENVRPGWEKALSKLPLEPGDLAEAAAFGRDLGALPLAEQCAAARSLRNLLAESRDSLAKRLPLKQKSIRAAYLLAGLLAAIILI